MYACARACICLRLFLRVYYIYLYIYINIYIHKKKTKKEKKRRKEKNVLWNFEKKIYFEAFLTLKRYCIKKHLNEKWGRLRYASGHWFEKGQDQEEPT